MDLPASYSAMRNRISRLVKRAPAPKFPKCVSDIAGGRLGAAPRRFPHLTPHQRTAHVGREGGDASAPRRAKVGNPAGTWGPRGREGVSPMRDARHMIQRPENHAIAWKEKSYGITLLLRPSRSGPVPAEFSTVSKYAPC